jgi:predicted DCC family thiol-disulfide oxidoreductase YuxK
MNAFERFWFTPVPAERLGAFRALVCGVGLYDVLLYAPLVFTDAAAVDAGVGVRPWHPILLMDVLGLGPVGIDQANALFTVAVVALALGAFGVLSRVSCAIGALAFLWWTGLAYSFGKPHHDKVALAFALCSLPFARVGAAVSIDAIVAGVVRARRGFASAIDAPTPQVSGVPIRLTQVTIAIGYFGAGAAKVVLGGPDWFNGYTLQGIMLGHDAEWSRAFAASPFLCQVQSLGLVFVQVAFPLVFLVPRARWYFLSAAAGFHLMTWKTMDTGPYLRLWLLLFAFVPMERVPSAMRGWLTGGGWRAVLAFAAAILPPVLVVSIVDVVVPTWALVGAGVPLVLAATLFVMPGARVAFVTDGGCRFCRSTAALIRRLDFARRVTFVDGNDALALTQRTPPLDPEACVRTVHLVDAAGRVRTGFDAYRSLAWRLPVVVPLAPLLYVPPVAWLGARVYAAVAARRLRVGCGVPRRGTAEVPRAS